MKPDDRRQPLTPHALGDPFGPPTTARPVRCLHCGESYPSSSLWWDGEWWRCPVEGCDGVGYGFDVHDVDSVLFVGVER